MSWVRLTADSLALTGPLILHGAILTDAAGGTVVFFDGLNTSGRRMFSLATVAALVFTTDALFVPGLPVERGLFADMSAAVDDLLVNITPVSEVPVAPGDTPPTETYPE